jgi:hypothetical protein
MAFPCDILTPVGAGIRQTVKRFPVVPGACFKLVCKKLQDTVLYGFGFHGIVSFLVVDITDGCLPGANGLTVFHVLRQFPSGRCSGGFPDFPGTVVTGCNSGQPESVTRFHVRQARNFCPGFPGLHKIPVDGFGLLYGFGFHGAVSFLVVNFSYLTCEL